MIAQPLKVSHLLSEVSEGNVLLPEIQRGYVWRGPQVAKLLDSLYREYPVGQILLWDTTLIPTARHVEGTKRGTLPIAGSPKIVLDGQQRLTSLHKALGDSEKEVNVCFHLESEEFERYSRRMDADARWVRVREVLNGTRHDLDILHEIEKAGLAASRSVEQRKYADRLQKLRRVSEYKFPIEIFKSDDYEEATELFVRINSAGTRLRSAELALAQLALRLPGAVVEKFERAMDEYAEVGYELDTRFLTRAFIATGTGQSRFRSLGEFWKKTDKELETIWKRTRRGVDAAVNFVRENAHFESSEWLPSLNALIPIANFFEQQTKIAHGVEVDLLQWFYIASLRGRYSGSAETALDEDLRTVQAENSVAGLLKNLGRSARDLTVSPDEFDDAGTRNPLFALTYAAARKAGAKDWFSGVKLSSHVVGPDHEIEIHHIFPKAVLREIRVQRKDRDEIANLAFLAARPNKQISNSPPDKYLPAIADEHPDRLIAQCIPMDRRLWKPAKFSEFLAERRRLLAQQVSELLSHPA